MLKSELQCFPVALSQGSALGTFSVEATTLSLAQIFAKLAASPLLTGESWGKAISAKRRETQRCYPKHSHWPSSREQSIEGFWSYSDVLGILFSISSLFSYPCLTAGAVSNEHLRTGRQNSVHCWALQIPVLPRSLLITLCPAFAISICSHYGWFYSRSESCCGRQSQVYSREYLFPICFIPLGMKIHLAWDMSASFMSCSMMVEEEACLKF